MSARVFPFFQTISHTPFRDLIRGRLTARLNWRSQIARANLPPDAAALITRVVKRTRLFRLEKADVANELLAHFADGLAAGASAAELVERFGDERVAARLIRRAKKRNRPLLWHILNFFGHVTLILLAFWAVSAIRFCLSQPTITVDYIARMNEPVLNTPPDDRAWPLWRKAILAASTSRPGGGREFSGLIDPRTAPPEGKPDWGARAKWLNEHAAAVELAREASQKPALGFILGPGGSGRDPELFAPSTGFKMEGPPTLTVLLPHLTELREMANILADDARIAAEAHDGARAEADVMAMLGVARQLRESDGIIVTQLVAGGIFDLALSRLRWILIKEPGSLNDQQLIELAHAISGPSVAADFITLSGERYFFADVLQSVYTNDGHGDGHATLKGIREVLALLQPMGGAANDISWTPFAIASSAPFMSASRAELSDAYDRWLDRFQSDFRQPIRQVDTRWFESEIGDLRKSPIEGLRYTLATSLIPGLGHLQTVCERYLGNRDGIEVGIALELYRRQHGSYPAILSQLTPKFLPSVPADRITGNPLKYRLIDGKPVVYSVGADRVDDGGKPPPKTSNGYRPFVALWDVAPDKAPKGDWVLFGPANADDDGD